MARNRDGYPVKDGKTYLTYKLTFIKEDGWEYTEILEWRHTSKESWYERIHLDLLFHPTH